MNKTLIPVKKAPNGGDYMQYRALDGASLTREDGDWVFRNESGAKLGFGNFRNATADRFGYTISYQRPILIVEN